MKFMPRYSLRLPTLNPPKLSAPDLSQMLHVELFDEAPTDSPQLFDESEKHFGEQTPVVFSFAAKPYLRFMKWGFVPYWKKADEDFTPIAFASILDVNKHLPFRESFSRRRCLVVNQNAEHKTETLAGIWDTWLDGDGKRMQGFALIGRRQFAKGRWEAMRVPQSATSYWLDHKATPSELHKRLSLWNTPAFITSQLSFKLPASEKAPAHSQSNSESNGAQLSIVPTRKAG